MKYTLEEETEIHRQEKLTLSEKTSEIMDIGLCLTGDAAGSAKNLCEKYNNDCYKCTSSVLEETGNKSFEPFNYELVHKPFKIKSEKIYTLSYKNNN